MFFLLTCEESKLCTETTVCSVSAVLITNDQCLLRVHSLQLNSAANVVNTHTNLLFILHPLTSATDLSLDCQKCTFLWILHFQVFLWVWMLSRKVHQPSDVDVVWVHIVFGLQSCCTAQIKAKWMILETDWRKFGVGLMESMQDENGTVKLVFIYLNGFTICTATDMLCPLATESDKEKLPKPMNRGRATEEESIFWTRLV